MTQIHDWANFCRTELNFLHTLKFICSFQHSSSDIVSFGSIAAPFQQPFWLTEKRWPVVCEYNFDSRGDFSLYTMPITLLNRSYESSKYGILFKDNQY